MQEEVMEAADPCSLVAPALDPCALEALWPPPT
jgi:hypothetical protein